MIFFFCNRYILDSLHGKYHYMACSEYKYFQIRASQVILLLYSMKFDEKCTAFDQIIVCYFSRIGMYISELILPTYSRILNNQCTKSFTATLTENLPCLVMDYRQLKQNGFYYSKKIHLKRCLSYNPLRVFSIVHCFLWWICTFIFLKLLPADYFDTITYILKLSCCFDIDFATIYYTPCFQKKLFFQFLISSNNTDGCSWPK